MNIISLILTIMFVVVIVLLVGLRKKKKFSQDITPKPNENQDWDPYLANLFSSIRAEMSLSTHIHTLRYTYKNHAEKVIHFLSEKNNYSLFIEMIKNCHHDCKEESIRFMADHPDDRYFDILAEQIIKITGENNHWHEGIREKSLTAISKIGSPRANEVLAWVIRNDKRIANREKAAVFLEQRGWLPENELKPYFLFAQKDWLSFSKIESSKQILCSIILSSKDDIDDIQSCIALLYTNGFNFNNIDGLLAAIVRETDDLLLLQREHPLRNLIKDQVLKLFDLLDQSINCRLQGKILQVIGYYDDEKIVDELIDRMNRNNISYRDHIIQTLGKIGHARAVDSLITMLEHDNRFLHLDAVEALGEIGDVRAVGPLLKSLDGNTDPRKTIQALGKIGDPAAIEKLVGIVKANSSGSRDMISVAMSAVSAIKQIGGQEALLALETVGLQSSFSVGGAIDEAISSIKKL